jgi:hypothetical protein
MVPIGYSLMGLLVGFRLLMRLQTPQSGVEHAGSSH